MGTALLRRNLQIHLLVLITMITSEKTLKDCVYEVVVDLTNPVGEMKRIWDNTGLSPPGPGIDAVKYLTSKEQKINLALIGSLPFKAISHVRIHWLLDLISVNLSAHEEKVTFDYQLLDDLILWLKGHGLRPGFELMGNPGNLFSDLETNPNTVVLWQNFITDLVNHYIEIYAFEEVKEWRFELWNEPESKQYNILNLTTAGYLRYALASVKGLKGSGIRVSGPAGTFRDFEHHNLSWSLLQLCDSMIAETGRCVLETITFHKKGEGMPQNVVNSTAQFYILATSLYPHLKTMQFANNEADILSGWWREEEWRGDVHYAAAVCQVLTSFLSRQFQQEFVSLSYISNDNGFINQPPAYFSQRTLLTRFQMNSSQDRPSQFVRKPVMVAMALLSYLGSKEMPVVVRHQHGSASCNTTLSVLAGGEGEDVASRQGWSAAVILANSGFPQNCSDTAVLLKLKLPSYSDMAYAVYRLDNVLTNPKNIWQSNGAPDFPDANVLKQMRQNEGPHVTERGAVEGDWKDISLQLRCPSVTLIHLCARSRNPPAKIVNLHAINVTYNEVLLLWQDSDTRCVKTYEVYFCKMDCLSEDYQLITEANTIMLAYQFTAQSSWSGEEATRGRYKVRVLDYWDQRSSFSDVLVY